MEKDSGLAIQELRVDGGATTNNLLMQLQASILNARVVRPAVTEVTALGAAYLAGLAVGFWENVTDIETQWQVQQQFEPEQNSNREQIITGWEKAVQTAKFWASLNQQTN
jgi:glycerol kinase